MFHAKNDKEMITAWNADLNRILQIFNVRSVGSVSLSLIAVPPPDRAGDQHLYRG